MTDVAELRVEMEGIKLLMIRFEEVTLSVLRNDCADGGNTMTSAGDAC